MIQSEASCMKLLKAAENLICFTLGIESIDSYEGWKCFVWVHPMLCVLGDCIFREITLIDEKIVIISNIIFGFQNSYDFWNTIEALYSAIVVTLLAIFEKCTKLVFILYPFIFNFFVQI